MTLGICWSWTPQPWVVHDHSARTFINHCGTFGFITQMRQIIARLVRSINNRSHTELSPGAQKETKPIFSMVFQRFYKKMLIHGRRWMITDDPRILRQLTALRLEAGKKEETYGKPCTDRVLITSSTQPEPCVVKSRAICQVYHNESIYPDNGGGANKNHKLQKFALASSLCNSSFQSQRFCPFTTQACNLPMR